MERLSATLAESATPAPAGLIVTAARPGALLLRLLNFVDQRKYPCPHLTVKRNRDGAIGIFNNAFCNGSLKLVFDQQAIDGKLR